MKQQNWFNRYGWLYIPANIQGFLITAAAIVFMVPVCIAVIRNGHSVSDDLYSIFVYATCVAFWWKWIAEKTSQEQ